jgi:bla regulator protein BlaR1
MNSATVLWLLNHLWQSTAFAAVAGLLTLSLRANCARIRHRIWIAASIKFLIPISAFVALGSQIHWTVASRRVPSQMAVVVNEISEPFTGSLVSSSPARGRRPTFNAFQLILALIWGCGSLGISGAWWVRWRRIRRAVRESPVMPLSLPVPVKVSPTVMEPSVFGIVRPVLLLPEGFFQRLDAVQQQAILAHELCHVRHRDNLAAATHMFVETVFWFHPLVWWIGKRMVEERERACDEEVLQLGNDPRPYAEGILNICRWCVQSPSAPMSGVLGFDLRTRIESIMTNRPAARLNIGKRAVLAVAGLCAVVAPFLIGMLQARHVQAQSVDAVVRKFDVASVKPCLVEPNTGNQRRQEYRASPGSVIIDCIPLDRIIFFAYAGIGNMSNPLLNDHPSDTSHVRGGPGWAHTEKFTIDAKAEEAADRQTMMGPMLRALLEERFHLKVHRETEEVPMYSLTVAKGGLKMQPIGDDGCLAPSTSRPSDGPPKPPQPGAKPVCGSYMSTGDGVNKNWLLGGETLERFANSTLSNVLDRFVMDQTGISGRFNIALQFALDDSIKPGVFGGGRAIDPPPAGVEKAPSIFVALQEQLGLKLDKTRGRHEFLLIDHVERPSAN